ncbi:MAG: carbon-nitrogen hydrolase family protein [Deltaproteobacteria bacterium]|nr:carbon-nitrogen hydrolase family protein [Deltaproteobacteria bacterium]
MKDIVNVAVVQFEPAPYEQKEKNLSYIISKVEELGKKGHELIIFPELSISNFFKHSPGARKDYWEKASEDIPGESINRIIEVSAEVNSHVIVGLASRTEKKYYMRNSAILIDPNGVVGVSHKIHLPQFEKFYFLPGGEPQVFKTPLGIIGLMVCYDFFFPETARVLGLKGAEIIVMIGSIWMGGAKGGGIGGVAGLDACKKKIVDYLPVSQALANQAHFIEADAGGGLDVGFGPWKRLGRSKIVSCLGEIVDSVDHAEEAVISAKLTNEDLALQRTGFNLYMDRMPSAYTRINEY